jgi:predicted enzyme related to lactoylglutathione lyase
MSNLPKSGAVLFAKDLPRVAKFYEGVAGLSVVHSEAEVIVLESPGQQLVLHGLPARVALAIQIGSPPKLRTDTAVKLVFAVASIAQARADAVAFGGEVNAQKKEFAARGFRACDGHDPEGNVIQFRENAP